MRLIAITPEINVRHEEAFIAHILDAGFNCVHVSKQAFSSSDMRQYLDRIPQVYHGRLKLHSCFELAAEYAVGGLHLNCRWPMVPQKIASRGFKVSKSCHSIDELADSKSYEYVFLSPIFDSISKIGYSAKFDIEELGRYFIESGCGNVVALGGVRPEYLPILSKCGFHGAAFLGYLFGADSLAHLDNLLNKITV